MGPALAPVDAIYVAGLAKRACVSLGTDLAAIITEAAETVRWQVEAKIYQVC